MDTTTNRARTTQRLVSIVMPSYNRANYIVQALQSALAQTYSDWELIVVDDASTDATPAIVAEYARRDTRIRYVRNANNSGIARSRNTGVAEARGAYVAMLDSDDAWIDPHKLQKQMDCFAKSEQDSSNAIPLGILGTWIHKMDDAGSLNEKVEFRTDDALIRKNILHKNPIAQSSVLLRADIVRKAGGYDESIVTMDDHDLWLRMAQFSRVAVLPEYTTGYRIHSGGITTEQRIKVATEELHIMWKYRKQYPGVILGMTKSLIRLLLALVSV